MSISQQKMKEVIDQIAQDYDFVFRSDQGKRVLRDIMMRGHMFESSFDEDPIKMALKNGERNIALQILDQLKDRRDIEDHLEDHRHDFGLHLHGV